MVKRFHLQAVAAGAAVFVVALAVRLILPWQDGALRYQMHNDDGVYYSTTVALWNGYLPYSDVVFLHPPGILLLLTPFTAIGAHFTDSTGLFVARLAWAALGALNAALVAALIWKWGRIAAISAGLLYATWGVVAIHEATIVQLVTVLNTMFLLAALILQRAPRRTFLAGVLIGIACATKIWAGVFVLVLVPYVWAKHGLRAALRLLAGAAVSGLVICAPYVLFNPGQAWASVVTDQLDRPHDVPPLKDALFLFLNGTAPDGDSTLGTVFVVVAMAAMAVPLIVVLIRRVNPRKWGDAPWLTILIATQIALLMLSPAFYTPYPSFVGPQVALMFGGLMVLVMRHARAAALVAVPVVAGASVLTFSEAQYFPIAHDELIDATSGYNCVWSLDATNLVLADVMSRNIKNGCSFDIDGFGVRVIDAESDDEWRRRVLAQIERADLVIMGVLEYQFLDELNRDYIRAKFHNDIQIDPGGVDTRERYDVERTND